MSVLHKTSYGYESDVTVSTTLYLVGLTAGVYSIISKSELSARDENI